MIGWVLVVFGAGGEGDWKGSGSWGGARGRAGRLRGGCGYQKPFLRVQFVNVRKCRMQELFWGREGMVASCIECGLHEAARLSIPDLEFQELD